MVSKFVEHSVELAMSAVAIGLGTGVAFLTLRLLCLGMEQKLRAHQR